ncbi:MULTISPECIES: hypothetical protein [Streptomyces]|nr:MULTISPECIES: hypothetical protein [Streptomyces]MYX51987.1 hypothetical protein [Streptomyces sp. SID8385]MYX85107.1 hypothetical protein [Streptomyces sp. SID4915]NVI30969.1 hypothetical protein [Streptomyces sp. CAI-17]MCX4462967.1 hypothetical protein [Streptomyces albidoflavus]QXQ28264.1 hypothetical protein STALF2_28050 [Streptomyces albidoflavus]
MGASAFAGRRALPASEPAAIMTDLLFVSLVLVVFLLLRAIAHGIGRS